LRLDSDDLIPDELQNSVDHGLETLQNLLVRKRHVTLLNAGLGKLCLDANVDCPLLAIVSEVGLYPVFKVHDAFRIDLASRLGAVWQFHFPNLGAQNVAEVAVEGCGTAGVTRPCCALGHGERCLFLYFVGDEIDGATTAVDNEHSVVDLEVEEARL